jgi:hypothetical protein
MGLIQLELKISHKVHLVHECNIKSDMTSIEYIPLNLSQLGAWTSMNTKYFKKGKLTSLYTDCIDTLCTTQRYGDAERDTGFCITLTSSS